MKLPSLLLIALLCYQQSVWARVKLVSLPERETSRVQLDNVHATLVEETRYLNVQQGVNKIDFSWKGVNILPDSIRLHIINAADEVSVLNVSYPLNEDALIWQLSSAAGQAIEVKISYLLQGIDRLIAYTAEVNPAETQVDLHADIILRNFSGESLQDTVFQLTDTEKMQLSIAQGETKRMRFLNASQLPITKRFTFDAATLPWEPKYTNDNVAIPVHYMVKNTKETGLGNTTLWQGKARLFSEAPPNGALFLSENRIKFTPIGDTFKLAVGNSRDVVVTQRILKQDKINIRRDTRGRIVLHDKDVTMEVKLENFKSSPALLRLKEPMPKEWEMRQHSQPFTIKDAQHIYFDLNLAAKDKLTVRYQYREKNIRH